MRDIVHQIHFTQLLLKYDIICLKLIIIIAVYIDSLVMISIERSETNKKEH